MIGSLFPALFAAGVTALPLAPVPEPEPAVAVPPNILIIVLDDLGTDRLALYGQASPTEQALMSTPNLDALAALGVKFTQAYASPVCSATRAMLLTGRHAYRTGMYNHIQGGSTEFTLPDSEVLIPEYLRAGGSWPQANPNYAFGAFGKWHVIENEPGADYCHPIRNGFDTFRGTVGNVGSHFRWTKVLSDVGAQPGVCGASSTAPVLGAWDAAVTRTDANAWIASVESLPTPKPWLAYVALHPPHLPLQIPDFFNPPSALDQLVQSLGYAQRQLIPAGALLPVCSSTIAQRFNQRVAQLSMIEHVDAEIGELIWDNGVIGDLRDNTYVFVIGDNGSVEEFMEIDPSVPPDPGDAQDPDDAPFPTGHAKRTVYQLGARVPLIVAGPSVAQGMECSSPVSAVDIYRTVCTLVGANLPFIARDSVDFSGLLANPLAQGTRVFAFAEFTGPNGLHTTNNPCVSPDWTIPGSNPPVLEGHVRTTTDGRWKYIQRNSADANVPVQPFTYCTPASCATLMREEFYNVASDPNELVNLIADPTLVAFIDAHRNAMNCLGGPVQYANCSAP